MNLFSFYALLLFGVVVGVFSGLMGLGGGSIMIPYMVIALGLTQAKAHGTSLAVMVVPVVLPAVIDYYRKGNVDVRVAGWMAAGFVLGSVFGAKLAQSMPTGTLKLVFGFLLIYVAGYTVFGKENLGRSVVLAAALVLIGVAMYAGTRAYDRRFAAAAAAAPPGSVAGATDGATTDTVSRR